MQTSDNLRPIGGPAIRRLEHGLLGLAVAALAAALWIMLDRDRPVAAITVTSAEVTESLPRWSHAPPPQVHMRLDAQPDARSREWLAALQRTGTDMSWETTADAVWQPMGTAVEPVADPRQPLRIWAATQGESPSEIVEIASPAAPAANRTDRADVQNIATLPSGTGVVNLRSLAGAVRLENSSGSAGATLRDTLELKPVLLLGRASWETRFVTAALEEHGWEVDARLSISPAQVVGEPPRPARPDGKAPTVAAGRGGGGGPGGRDPGGRGPRGRGPGGGPGAAGAVARPAGPGEAVPAARDELIIDSERYSAVIVLDDSAAPYSPAIAAFIDEGGGAALLGHGAAIPALRELLPAVASGPVQEARGFAADEPVTDGIADGAVREDNTSGPRSRLELRPLLQLRNGAHAVERRGDDIAVAIHRSGNGRVLQAGYADTWRWRMASPDEDAPEASREWLAGLLGMIAHAARADKITDMAGLTLHDPAPVAAWHSTFGPQRPAKPAEDASAGTWAGRWARTWPNLLHAMFMLAVLALLLQWLSRRLRGGC